LAEGLRALSGFTGDTLSSQAIGPDCAREGAKPTRRLPENALM